MYKSFGSAAVQMQQGDYLAFNTGIANAFHGDGSNVFSIASNIANPIQVFVEQPAIVGAAVGIDFTTVLPSSNKAIESVIRQISEIRELKDNWDGYGAHPIPEQVLITISKDLATSLAGFDCASPDLIPGGDKSVQAEWHLRDVEFSYHLSASGERSAWIHERSTGREHFASGSEAQEALRKWVPLLG